MYTTTKFSQFVPRWVMRDFCTNATFASNYRCTPNFDIQHEVSVKSKHLLPISKNKGSVRVSCVFRVWVNTAFIFT